jgi:ribosomal protein S18 acetylase RimI-like enzyme
MIQYKRCSEVSKELTYKVFRAGFADYMIQFKISQEDFFKRFFGPEGNILEHSFIALEEEKPIGLVLGGIRDFEGRKTMRCGTMCVIPEYRMRGISVRLFELHKENAIKNGCQQLFLEVITQNKPAAKFYKRIGYQKAFDLVYFHMDELTPLKKRSTNGFNIDAIQFEDVMKLRSTLKGFHINWQNEMEYIQKLENQCYYGIFEAAELVAALSINKTGQFYFLWVDPNRRERGMATALFTHAANQLELEKIKAGFPNNGLLECYLMHIGFAKDKITQYEMYLPL